MTTPFAKFKNALLAAVGLLVLSNVLLLMQRNTAQAQSQSVSPGVNLAALVAEVKALQAQNAVLQVRVIALETKTAPLSLSGTPGRFPATLTVTGVNVQIVSGKGSTDDGTKSGLPGSKLSGLGNLILGYNRSGGGTGSHNLVLGDDNTYLSYGGLVAGEFDIVSGPYATVTGGDFNLAGGSGATVSGGSNGQAVGDYSAVSGGSGNKADGSYSAVSGGVDNEVGGDYAAVGGGFSVFQKTEFGWAAGSLGSAAYSGSFHSP